jgi:hypothetical protein
MTASVAGGCLWRAVSLVGIATASSPIGGASAAPVFNGPYDVTVADSLAPRDDPRLPHLTWIENGLLTRSSEHAGQNVSER